MHTPLILAVVAFGLTCYTLAKVYSKQKQDLKTQREALEYKLIGESAKILDELNQIKAQIAILQMNTNPIANLEKMMMFPPKVELSAEKRLPPANRKPRTEEQKRLAAEQKKAWWAEKRAKEEEEKKRAQEQNVPAPSLVGEPANVS